MPLNLATMSPAARASSVTWLLAERKGLPAAPAAALFPRSAHSRDASGLGMKRVELALRHAAGQATQLDRNIVEPAGREAAIEVPQSRNDDAHDRNLDVGTGLVEDEKVEAFTLGEVHAGHHLLALVESAELRAEVRPHRRALPFGIR